jgi:hypothetical protein
MFKLPDHKDRAKTAAEAKLAKSARDAQISALREQIDGYGRLKRLAEDIAQFTGSLRFSDVSPLAFEDQLAAARALFDTTLNGARSGDANAQGQLTQNARAYLDEARAYFGSSAGYADIFAQVTGSLDSLGLSALNTDAATVAAQQQLAALESVTDTLVTGNDISGEELAALINIDAALARREETNARAIDRQVELAQQLVIGGHFALGIGRMIRADRRLG